MTKQLYFFLFFLSCVRINAQAQCIRGNVQNPDATPAAFATLRLLKAADSTLISGAAADENGAYQFSAVPQGQYLVRAALIGFADDYSPVFSIAKEDISLSPLQLRLSNDLKEVQITARKPLIETRPDMVILHVEGSALAAGNSAYELLQRSPGVVITPQENIMLQGKGSVLITLNGRPTQMNAQELAAFLKGLPAESIASIELINSPSSKYDAQGIGGIINIRLKKNKNLGWNGNLSLGNTQAIHHRLRGGAQFNYRPGKINLFGSINMTDAAQSVQQDIERRTEDKVFVQSMPKIDVWQSLQFQSGADYSINDRNSVGFLMIGSNYDNTTRADIQTMIRPIGSITADSSIEGRFRNPEHNKRNSYNLNYRYADTTGTEWTFDADQIQFDMRGQNQINNQRINASNEVMSTEAVASNMFSDLIVWSLKSDYSKTYKNGYKIGSGAKANWTSSMNDIQGATDFGTGLLPDAQRTNRAEFRERIVAAYFNASKEGEKFSWQLGLRGEHTDLEGVSTDIAQQQTPIRNNQYLNFFPTAFAQYNLNTSGNALGFSYNRRIDRPAYQDLNPFIWQLDAFSSERGNPNLRPAYIHSTELKYTYKYAASISLGYAHTNDLVSTLARLEGEQAFTQPENLSQQDNVSLNVSAPTPIRSWWEGYAWIGVWHNRFQSNFPEGRFERNAWGGGAYLGQQIHLPRSTQFEFSFWAQFPTSNGLLRNTGIWSIDLGLKKKLFHDKATIKLGVYDVFNSQHWTDKVNFANLKGSIRNDWESQALALQFSWSFGNQNMNNRTRKSGAEAENGRIKGGKNN